MHILGTKRLPIQGWSATQYVWFAYRIGDQPWVEFSQHLPECPLRSLLLPQLRRIIGLGKAVPNVAH